ncbi:hypothetical protein ACIBG8_20590 [Nonomuraea sp. NPDC050556]|uniref:hypothetical protein n=1 Tax=Nonomuraea sp. NPDC050556 TaxID=3364369 RepID=UPI0037940848
MSRRWARQVREVRLVRYFVLPVATVLTAIVVARLFSPPPSMSAPARHAEASCESRQSDQPVGGIVCAGVTLTLSSGAKRTLDTAATRVVAPAVYTDPGPMQPTDIPFEPRWTADVDVPTVIGGGGYRVAYLDAREHRFVALDLRTGRKRPLTPVLSAEEIGKRSSLAISMDGRLFAVSLAKYPRVIVTDFDTGRARDVPGICQVKGLNDDVLVGNRWCWTNRGGNLNALVAVHFDGSKPTPLDNWFLAGPTTRGIYLTLSRDPRNLLLYDVKTGQATGGARLPRGLTVLGWLDEQYVLVQSKSGGSSRFDVRTGAQEEVYGVWSFGTGS